MRAMQPMRKGPAKTFQRNGRWIVNPKKTEVFVCTCGAKFIVTRAEQTTCIKCHTES